MSAQFRNTVTGEVTYERPSAMGAGTGEVVAALAWDEVSCG